MDRKRMIQVCGGLMTTVALALGLFLAPAALGQGSGADQYSETLPSGGGDETTGGGNGNINQTNGGGDGRESSGAGDTTGSTAPSVTPSTGSTESSSTGSSTGSGGSSQPNDRPSGGSGQADLPSATPTKPLDTASNATPSTLSTTSGEEDDGGGLGIGLPIALGLLAVAAIGYVLYRRRSGGGGVTTAVRKPSTSQG